MNTADEDPVVVKAKQHFTEGTWEPDSVEFRNMVRAMRPNVRGEMMDFICGEMNGKNGKGEFTGFVPVAYDVKDEKGYIASGGGLPEELLARMVYNNMCK